MPALPVDITSGQWREVTRYVEQRIAELTEVCTSPTATDDARLTHAHRIDELKQLLNAPSETRRQTEQRAQSTPNTY